jgi:hypothetical protein
MANKLSFDDVIETHRQNVGAEKVHVTLGDKATPEGLAEELRKIREKGRLHAAFTEVEIEKSKVARLRKDFGKITKLCQHRIDQDMSQAEINRRLSDIFSISDMFVDVSLEEDTIWMADQRLKNGRPLPEGVTVEQIDALRL